MHAEPGPPGRTSELIGVKVFEIEIADHIRSKRGGEKNRPAAGGTASFVVNAAATAWAASIVIEKVGLAV